MDKRVFLIVFLFLFFRFLCGRALRPKPLPLVLPSGCVAPADVWFGSRCFPSPAARARALVAQRPCVLPGSFCFGRFAGFSFGYALRAAPFPSLRSVGTSARAGSRIARGCRARGSAPAPLVLASLPTVAMPEPHEESEVVL